MSKTSTNNAAWPSQDKLDNSTLIFSGSFDPERMAREQSHYYLKLAEKVLLSIVVVLGLAGLALSVRHGYQVKALDFFLISSQFNLAFWIAVFLGAYLWAQIKQQSLDEQQLNLLRWDENNEQGKTPSQLDVYTFFDTRAKRVWNRSFQLAKKRQQQAKLNQPISVSALDLMLALLKEESVMTVFFRLNVDPRDLSKFLQNYSKLQLPVATAELDSLPFVAFHESLKLHNKALDPLMLLCALKIILPDSHVLQAIFFNIDVSLEDLETVCAWFFNIHLLQEEVQILKRFSRFKPAQETNRGLTAIPTPYLDRFSTDLTMWARYGRLPLALGRGRDLQEIFKLMSSGKKNILIKGSVGTGRATVINELAYKMTTEQVPASLSDMRLIRLETASIVGNPLRAEQTLIQALTEASRSDNIILVVADIHNLARAQTTVGISLLEVMVDFLQSHNLTIFATTTNEDSSDYLQTSAGFSQTFTPYELKTLTPAEILLACCVRASILEVKNRCFFRYPAIKKAVELTNLYIKDASQPQKAIAILVQAATLAKSGPNHVVTKELIETIISDQTHIPNQNLSQDEGQKLLHLEDELSKYIVGQTQAVVAVAEGLRRARSGLSSESRPLASFLFLGPTGVGKTEIAKTLAKVYFGEQKFLLRLDMSEYQGEDGLNKLIGSEGNKTDTALIKHLKNYPFCLLLLDEFEKASPQVLNLFLQILEDARLTSSKGETIDLTHCLIIATSNAGSADIQTGIKAGQSIDQIKSRLLDEILLKHYPPELLNRFDSVVIFSPLSESEVASIVHLQLDALSKQLLNKGIKVEFSSEVAEHVAKNAFEPSLGARPIRRYIQDHIETFIAKLVLQGTAKRGTELVVDIKDGQLVID